MYQTVRNSVAIACSIAAITWSLSAQAQTASAAAADSSGDSLQEIIVTAERRTEDIEKTPIPVTAISGVQIESKGQTQIDEVLRDVPSVQIQSNPQGADVVVRGLGGNDTGGISQDPDVSIFEDGIYSSQSAQNLSSVYDVNRVEVLRGPQGTLYGRNSAGGAVSILTNDPGNAFGFGLNAGYGNYDSRHLDAFVNLPASDLLSFRLAVDRDLRNGYYTNGAGEVDNEGLRFKAKFSLDSLTLLARFEYMRQQGYTETTVPVAGVPSAATACGGPPCFLFVSADPSNPYETKTQGPGVFSTTPIWNHNEFFTYSLQADWDMHWGVLTVLPTYSSTVQEQSSASLFAPSTPPFSIGTTSTGQSTLEARVSSEADSALKWVAGGFALRSNANQAGAAPGGTSAAQFYTQQSNNRRPASSYAGFGQITYPFTDQLRTDIGARYTVDEKSIFYGVCSSNPSVYPACGPSEVTGAGTYISPAVNLSTRYSAFTYTAGIDYDMTPTTMDYAKISSGYKAGGWSTAVSPPIAYAPERLTDFELGIKSRLDNNKLQINADLYYYLYHNQQVELHEILPYTDAIPAQYVPATWQPGGAEATANPYSAIVDANAGNSRFFGAETQIDYQATPHDLFNFQIAWEHAKYGSFVIPIAANAPPGGGDGTATSFDLSGKTEAHVPEWNGSFSYQHVWDIGNGQLTARGNIRFQTWTYTTIQEWFANGNTIQGGYHMSDLQLRYASSGDRWAVWGWVSNLENKTVVNYVYPLYKESLDAPRMYGVNVSFKY